MERDMEGRKLIKVFVHKSKSRTKVEARSITKVGNGSASKVAASMAQSISSPTDRTRNVHG